MAGKWSECGVGGIFVSPLFMCYYSVNNLARRSSPRKERLMISDENDMPTQKLVDLEKIFRDAGLKMTHQRMMIYREILAAGDHPSVETLFSRVQQNIPTISIDTVYRTLAVLGEYGLISKIHTSAGHARFETESALHHHLLCTRCQRLTDFTWESLDGMPLPPEAAAWGRISGKKIVMEGICRECLKGEEKGK